MTSLGSHQKILQLVFISGWVCFGAEKAILQEMFLILVNCTCYNTLLKILVRSHARTRKTQVQCVRPSFGNLFHGNIFYWRY